jgi:putative ABC transport system substrate-binding protein
MRRLQFVAHLGVSLLIATPAYPQSVEPNIGFMSTRSANDSTRVVAAFVKGLQEVGFDEGRNVSIEYRFADGALDRLPEIANDLVRGLGHHTHRVRDWSGSDKVGSGRKSRAPGK